jgi:hypothetical protein
MQDEELTEYVDDDYELTPAQQYELGRGLMLHLWPIVEEHVEHWGIPDDVVAMVLESIAIHYKTRKEVS